MSVLRKIENQLNNIYTENKFEAFEIALTYTICLAGMMGKLAPDKVELEVGLQEFMQDFKRLAYEAFEKKSLSK